MTAKLEVTDTVRTDAMNLRKLVREAEAVSDEAMIALSKLKQAMVQARQNPDIPVHLGQSAMMRLTQAEQKALDMSTSLLRVHDEMSKVTREFAGGDAGEETVIPKAALHAELDSSEKVAV